MLVAPGENSRHGGDVCGRHNGQRVSAVLRAVVTQHRRGARRVGDQGIGARHPCQAFVDLSAVHQSHPDECSMVTTTMSFSRTPTSMFTLRAAPRRATCQLLSTAVWSSSLAAAFFSFTFVSLMPGIAVMVSTTAASTSSVGWRPSLVHSWQ